MSGLNMRGPNEEGPMTGRKMGKCNPDSQSSSKDEMFVIAAGLAVGLIIGLAKIAGIWMKEKHLKNSLKQY